MANIGENPMLVQLKQAMLSKLQPSAKPPPDGNADLHNMLLGRRTLDM